jgi:hypothetical protein
MGLINVDFNLHHTPNPIGVNVAVELKENKITVTLVDIPVILVTASPNFSGNIATGIISSLVTPIANGLTIAISSFASSLLSNKRFDVASVPTFNFDVSGGKVRLEPQHLKLENFNGGLMLSGNLNIS